MYEASLSFANARSVASSQAGRARADHARDDAVAPRLVGDADDGDLGDRGVLAEHLLDLEGAQLVAAALEDVDARAAEDPERRVPVVPSRVTVSPVLNQGPPSGSVRRPARVSSSRRW